MKKTFGCRLAFMLALSAATSVGPQLPVAMAAPAPNFAPKGEGFSVWLPSKSQSSLNKIPVKGRAPITARMYTLSVGPISYIILPVPMPAKLSAAGASQYVKNAEKRFISSTGATVTSAKNVTLNGYKGRAIEGGLGENVMKTRIYAGNRHSFQIIAGSPKYKTVAQSAQIEKVLSSFKITAPR